MTLLLENDTHEINSKKITMNIIANANERDTMKTIGYAVYLISSN